MSNCRRGKEGDGGWLFVYHDVDAHQGRGQAKRDIVLR